MRVDQCKPLCCEGGRKIHRGAARQRAEASVEVVECRIGQRQSNARHAELCADNLARLQPRAEAAAHPEQPAVRIPEAIAGAFECDAWRQRNNVINQTPRAQGMEGRSKDRFLDLPLRLAERATKARPSAQRSCSKD